MNTELRSVKAQEWFYEFILPDGTKTNSYLPEFARGIHITREKALRIYLESSGANLLTAIDVACHEAYYSLVLRDYFEFVVGVDKNEATLNKAREVCSVLGRTDISFVEGSLEDLANDHKADFVLCFGLLYHVENPIQVMRKLGSLTVKAICIETQVLPYHATGFIEDGSYRWQRDLTGMFGLCADYSGRAEGGLTDLALVPSRQALEFLLREVGFETIRFYEPAPDDYEQFVRGHRVIVFAEK